MRPAATLMLLRDGARGLEVLMTRRSMTASFAPGAYVFPGGMLEQSDRDCVQHAVVKRRANQNDEVCALAVAAIREAFEELGILLADVSDVSQLDRSQTLVPQIIKADGQLSVDQLVSFSHWRTDRDLPKRFDVRFFAARMPDGQEAVADQTEQFEPIWINPILGLEQHALGQFNIIFPTIRTLRKLSQFNTVEAALDASLKQTPLAHFCPRAGWLNQQEARYTKDEAPYGELKLVNPDGQIAHTLDWQHEKSVKLLHNVQRLTSPNPSMMTGPGTNTYIIGEPGSYAIIDPGPDDAFHIQKLAQLVGNDLKWIFCTHSHPDHHPGAARLQDLTGAKIAGLPLVQGDPNKPYPIPSHWQFNPDYAITNGERFELGDSTLRAIHTPGHASNHVCFVLEQDRLLFSGDHILNGVSPVIMPPDGDMWDYLHSLEQLKAEPIDFILPAHGYVLGHAVEAIQKLIDHRLKREAKVLASFERLRSADVSKLVTTVYDDVDKSLHTLAQRSLQAHILKLVKDGKIPPQALERI